MENNMSQAAQIIMSLIPIVGIAFASLLIFFALLWRHHENKLKISKGTYVPTKFDLRAFSLMSGLSLVGVGIVLTVMFLILNGFSWSLIGGLTPLAVGLAMLIFYKINPDFSDKKADED